MIRVFQNNNSTLKCKSLTVDATKLYFKAKEVALALGYENTRDALARHVPDEYKKRLGDHEGS